MVMLMMGANGLVCHGGKLVMKASWQRCNDDSNHGSALKSREIKKGEIESRAIKRGETDSLTHRNGQGVGLGRVVSNTTQSQYPLLTSPTTQPDFLLNLPQRVPGFDKF